MNRGKPLYLNEERYAGLTYMVRKYSHSLRILILLYPFTLQSMIHSAFFRLLLTVWIGVPRFLARLLLVPSSLFSSNFTRLVTMLRSDM